MLCKPGQELFGFAVVVRLLATLDLRRLSVECTDKVRFIERAQSELLPFTGIMIGAGDTGFAGI